MTKLIYSEMNPESKTGNTQGTKPLEIFTRQRDCFFMSVLENELKLTDAAVNGNFSTQDVSRI